MTKSVDFDYDDAASEAGVDPWRRHDDFLEELDPEAILEAAKAYEDAAQEATTVADFAAAATVESTESATYSGGSLVLAESRLESTLDDVQGQSLEGTVGSLHRVVTAANEAQANNHDEIFGVPESGENIQFKVNGHSRDAQEELSGWYEQLDAAIESYNARPLYRAFNAGPVINPPAGSETGGLAWGGSVRAEMDGNTADVPDSVVQAIREHYLEKAADDVRDADERIQANIEDYRSVATKEAAELEGEGYDLGGSGLDIWHTPEMAEHHAKEIENAVAALGEDSDDEDARSALHEATLIAGAATNGLVDEWGNPVGELSESERDYLLALNSSLSAQTLADLGNLGLAPANQPVLNAPEPILVGTDVATAQQNIANGINAVFNPDVGGFDPEVSDIPESVQEYLFGFDTTMENATPRERLDLMDQFNGFGHLVGQATVPPGDTFGTMSYEAAVDVQRFVHDLHDEREYSAMGGGMVGETLGNVGSSGLLHSVSLNSELSHDLMTDENNRLDMMDLQWPDSSGAGAVLGAAINEPSADQAARDEIADHVIDHLSRDETVLVPDWDPDYRESKDAHVMFDPTGLQGALSDATLARMDRVVGGGDGLGDSEREQVFRILAASDEGVYEHFKRGVYTWQGDTAQELYEGTDPGDITNEDFRHIAVATDSLNLAEQEYVKRYTGTADEIAAAQQKFDRATIGGGMLIASGVTMTTGMTATGVWLTHGLGGNMLVQGTFSDYVPQAPSELHDVRFEEGYMNNQAAYYAVLNGVAAAQGAEGLDVDAAMRHHEEKGRTAPDGLDGAVGGLDLGGLDGLYPHVQGSDDVPYEPRPDDGKDDEDDDEDEDDKDDD